MSETDELRTAAERLEGLAMDAGCAGGTDWKVATHESIEVTIDGVKASNPDGGVSWNVKRDDPNYHRAQIITFWIEDALLIATMDPDAVRAVAALLRAVDAAGPSIDDDEECIVQAALAVARAVSGDLS